MSEAAEQAPRRLIAALMLTATLNPLNSTMIAVALPAIAAHFGASAGTVTTWLVSSYLIVNIVAATPAGRLGDLLGRRRTLWLGQAILAFGALLGGLSPVLPGVVVGRILMATGGALVIPTVMAVLRAAVAPERRARTFAALGSLMGVAAATGPVLGGFLTARVGWQAIFLVNAPVLLIAWACVGRAAVAAPPPETRRSFDGLGALLLGIALGALVVGLKVAEWRWGLLPLAGLATLAFLVRQRRAPEPLLDLRLFRERHFVAGALVIALQNLSMYALMFQLPFLLEGSFRIDAEHGGRILMTMMVAMVVSAPIGGRISERIGIRTTALLGLALGSGALLLLLRAVSDLSLTQLTVGLAGLGVGLGLVGGPAQAAALSAVSSDRGGVASGVVSTMRYLGGVIGVGFISVVLVPGDAAQTLSAHRSCLWAYLGAHAAALVAAALLPSRVKA